MGFRDGSSTSQPQRQRCARRPADGCGRRPTGCQCSCAGRALVWFLARPAYFTTLVLDTGIDRRERSDCSLSVHHFASTFWTGGQSMRAPTKAAGSFVIRADGCADAPSERLRSTHERGGQCRDGTANGMPVYRAWGPLHLECPLCEPGGLAAKGRAPVGDRRRTPERDRRRWSSLEHQRTRRRRPRGAEAPWALIPSRGHGELRTNGIAPYPPPPAGNRSVPRH